MTITKYNQKNRGFYSGHQSEISRRMNAGESIPAYRPAVADAVLETDAALASLTASIDAGSNPLLACPHCGWNLNLPPRKPE